ncbi:MAG: folylpolyglutamate synthase/dihydrofolate synthase family protein [Synergistaceae bacterium]|nr:folylpolyglutamate synthase/dihydrofolate synthase family protein [Synergistaceae bacterium]
MEIKFSEIENELQKIASPGIHPGLARLSKLLALLGNPERQFKAVHVVGTNGKGSTSAAVENILRCSGCKTALYTSPHLACFGERLLINGEMLPAADWLRVIERIKTVLKNSGTAEEDMPTYFELTTASAFMLTAQKNVDIAVIEAGLGGRLDATNTLENVVLTLVTPIGIDHTDYLGDTLEKIAAEKFAVIRRNVPAIFAGGDETLEKQFLEKCAQEGTNGSLLSKTEYSLTETSLDGTILSFRGKSYKTALAGAYQADNTALALSAAEELRKSFGGITEETVRTALSTIKWQGRMEIVRKNPLLLLDGAHNPHAIKRLAENIKLIFKGQKICSVTAMMRDKDVKNALGLLKELNLELYCTEVPQMERSMKAEEMAETAENLGFDVRGNFDSPYDAVKEASKQGCPVLCFGSLYMLAWLKENYPEEFLK